METIKVTTKAGKEFVGIFQPIFNNECGNVPFPFFNIIGDDGSPLRSPMFDTNRKIWIEGCSSWDIVYQISDADLNFLNNFFLIS